MNSNMMNRNSMGCINRGCMNQRNMESSCHRHGMDNNQGDCGHSGNNPMNRDCNCPMPEKDDCSRPGNMPGNHSRGCSGNMPGDNGCGCSGNMTGDNGCGCSGNMPGNNGYGCSENLPNDQQLMSMNKNQLLNYLNQVSFNMYDAVLFLDTHPTDREAIAYFNVMKQARKSALKIYQKKFAPLLLDGVNADCEWTWGMEPLPWENCYY